MREYQATLADMHFVLRKIVGRKLIAQLPGFEDVSLDPAAAVLDEVPCVQAVATTPARRLGASSSRCRQLVTRITERFNHFVTSMAAPVASGWSICWVGLAPTGKRRLSTAHVRSGSWKTRSR